MFSKLTNILTSEKKNNFDGSVFIYWLFRLQHCNVRYLYYLFFLLILYKFINVQITIFFVLQKLFSN